MSSSGSISVEVYGYELLARAVCKYDANASGINLAVGVIYFDDNGNHVADSLMDGYSIHLSCADEEITIQGATTVPSNASKMWVVLVTHGNNYAGFRNPYVTLNSGGTCLFLGEFNVAQYQGKKIAVNIYIYGHK